MEDGREMGGSGTLALATNSSSLDLDSLCKNLPVRGKPYIYNSTTITVFYHL